MIITIDGPAGTGKSTVAQATAQALGFDYLDTGAMYRAVGLAALRRGVDLHDAAAVAQVARTCRVDFDFDSDPPEPLLDGQRVGSVIRSADVTHASSVVATVPEVRRILVARQQEIGTQRPNLVSEGRDQGSVVFPHAELKFYLDAAPAERARRRVEQLRKVGENPDYQEILRQILARDHRDSTRSAAPLSVPAGAEVIDTTDMPVEQVVAIVVDKARRLMSSR